jgi:hypothetical protein
VPVVLIGQGQAAFEFFQSETSASSKASRICAKRLAASMPGWISSVAAWASARMRPDHSGGYRPFSATRSSVSASAMGTSTQASSTAV